MCGWHHVAVICLHALLCKHMYICLMVKSTFQILSARVWLPCNDKVCTQAVWKALRLEGGAALTGEACPGRSSETETWCCSGPEETLWAGRAGSASSTWNSYWTQSLFLPSARSSEATMERQMTMCHFSIKKKVKVKIIHCLDRNMRVSWLEFNSNVSTSEILPPWWELWSSETQPLCTEQARARGSEWNWVRGSLPASNKQNFTNWTSIKRKLKTLLEVTL